MDKTKRFNVSVQVPKFTDQSSWILRDWKNVKVVDSNGDGIGFETEAGKLVILRFGSLAYVEMTEA